MQIQEEIIKELSKGIKTQKDLEGLTRQLMKNVIEAALHAELDNHLGYEKHAKSDSRKSNTRNGHSLKRVRGDFGEVDIQTPRDRESTFEPQLLPKNKTRLEGFEEKILHLYARGMTTRDIQEVLKEMYHADVSHSVISQVTGSVIE